MATRLHNVSIRVDLTPNWLRKVVRDGARRDGRALEVASLLGKALLFSQYVKGIEFSWRDERVYVDVLLPWGETLDQLEIRRRDFVELLRPMPGTVLMSDTLPDGEVP